jgi:hypothetical protein
MYGASYENLFFGNYDKWRCSKQNKIIYSIPSGVPVSSLYPVPEWCPLEYYKSAHSLCYHFDNGTCLHYLRDCNLEVGNEKYCKNYEESNDQ